MDFPGQRAARQVNPDVADYVLEVRSATEAGDDRGVACRKERSRLGNFFTEELEMIEAERSAASHDVRARAVAELRHLGQRKGVGRAIRRRAWIEGKVG